jgi:hypothetical protein
MHIYFWIAQITNGLESNIISNYYYNNFEKIIVKILLMLINMPYQVTQNVVLNKIFEYKEFITYYKF